MSHGIEIVVCHHLRFTARSTGEIHQHRVVVGIDESGSYELRGLFPFCLPIVESLRNRFAVVGDGDILLHRWTLRHGGLDLTDDIGVVDADDSLDGGAGVTIYDIVLGEHMGRGDDDGTNLMQGQHHYPPLITALQNKHHGVVLADAERQQI